jgi:hypothetical protein
MTFKVNGVVTGVVAFFEISRGCGSEFGIHEDGVITFGGFHINDFY